MHHQAADFAAGSRGDRHGRKGAEHPLLTEWALSGWAAARTVSAARPDPCRRLGGGQPGRMLRRFHGDLSGALRDSFWCGWMEKSGSRAEVNGADGVTTCRMERWLAHLLDQIPQIPNADHQNFRNSLRTLRGSPEWF
jgi:hypothetical protein